MSSLFLLILTEGPESIKTVKKAHAVSTPLPSSLRLLEKKFPDIKDIVSVVLVDNKKIPATDKAWPCYYGK
jgi:hypothetical protein